MSETRVTMGTNLIFYFGNFVVRRETTRSLICLRTHRPLGINGEGSQHSTIKNVNKEWKTKSVPTLEVDRNSPESWRGPLGSFL